MRSAPPGLEEKDDGSIAIGYPIAAIPNILWLLTTKHARKIPPAPF
jgi:hypothetical protein